MPVVLLILLLCVYLMLTLLGMHAVPALLPQLREVWGLSNTQAGWLAGIPYLTYALGVAFIGITDRIDAKRLMILGALINAVGYGGLGFADDFWTAMFFRVLQGLGLAWSYLPGIKAISDRTSGKHSGRLGSIYVSSFAFGSGFSVLIAARVAETFGWSWAFALPALGNLLAAGLLFALLPSVRHEKTDQPLRLLPDFPAIWRNRPAVGFIISTFCHHFELLGVRAWTVSFLSWVMLTRDDIGEGWNVALIATLLILVGVPTSLMGGEIGHRAGYARTAVLAMGFSAVVAMLVGYSAAGPLWLFVALVLAHNFLVLADSGVINAGAMTATAVDERGNVLAGFGLASALGGLMGPVAFGYILDRTGAGESSGSWGMAFLCLGLVMVLGAGAIRILSWRK